MDLLAWINGELLIWLDSDRGHALDSIAKGFERDLAIKVTIDTPENIIDGFRLAAQAAKRSRHRDLVARQDRRMGRHRINRPG